MTRLATSPQNETSSHPIFASLWSWCQSKALELETKRVAVSTKEAEIVAEALKVADADNERQYEFHKNRLAGSNMAIGQSAGVRKARNSGFS